ncbi:MAG: hypothetical protein DCE90_05540 [Pseudanabaena sp.]|nr:MAG: hypothetical protein DCE90_05540 [Pseudanabaena sp.]
MVDPSLRQQQSDTEVIAVPQELAPLLQEIVNLYYRHPQQNLVESLQLVVDEIKEDSNYLVLKNKIPPTYANSNYLSDEENETDFLKSWDDIFNVQIYVDTDIYGELDPRPPAIAEAESSNIDGETVIQHTEATEAYLQTWKELAQSISTYPDDLFTRLWTTIEIAKILECSPSTLRRARRNRRLPLRIKELILDCISHDGKRSLWFVRPA